MNSRTYQSPEITSYVRLYCKWLQPPAVTTKSDLVRIRQDDGRMARCV